jgi:hypothetical protein
VVTGKRRDGERSRFFVNNSRWLYELHFGFVFRGIFNPRFKKRVIINSLYSYLYCSETQERVGKRKREQNVGDGESGRPGWSAGGEEEEIRAEAVPGLSLQQQRGGGRYQRGGLGRKKKSEEGKRGGW